MFNKFIICRIVIVLFVFSFFNVTAQIRLPNVFGSNMVLQSKQPVPVWGWSQPKSSVTVIFKGQQMSTRAGNNGYWKVTLSPLSVSMEQAEMLIISGRDSLKLNNILVGEVWLCSGQSNMRYAMKNNYQKPEKTDDTLALELGVIEPQIRLFFVHNKLNVPDVITTGWKESAGEALENFSAIGYFFAKNIHYRLNVPVGIICSAYNGTQIEPWTPVSAYINSPSFKDELNQDTHLINGVKAGSIFESMVKPLAPFAIKGILWYQGESNTMTNEGIHYAEKMNALIGSWRAAWNNSALPFYYVELAPFTYTHRKTDKVVHTTETLPQIWEAQSVVLKTPFTEIVTISDLIDKPNNLHPPL